MSKTYKYRKSIVVGHKPDGTQIRKIIRSDSKKDFEAQCRYYETLHAKGVDLSTSGLTVEEWAWLWLKTYKQGHIGPSQYRNLEIIIRKHITPALGFMQLRDVKQMHVQRFINSLAGQSKSQLIKVRGTLKQIYEQAYNNNRVESNPVRGIILPAAKEGHRRALTASERQALEKICQTHRGGLWVRLMLECGLRRGETVPLRWGDIDFSTGILTVNKAVEFVTLKNKATLKETKTEAGERKIPIPPALLADLKKARGKAGANALLFTNRDGSMMSQQKIRLLWANVKREWDIAIGAALYRNKITVHALDQAITPHYLRHTYATFLCRQGVKLKTAQYLLGHADIRTTANIYTHVEESDIRLVRDTMFGRQRGRYRILKRAPKGDPSVTPQTEKRGQNREKEGKKLQNASTNIIAFPGTKVI